jgi:UDP-4-amino-4,6-dideoxy-N-acetyl-beta-L-altrosamine transaminase
MIPYGRQSIDQSDIDAVVNVLRSDFLTQGREVPDFEHALCQYSGAKHSVAVNSATSALHIACVALELGSGDILWTSPITFVASANCALYCGASIDFVDIDPTTRNMSVASLRSKLVQAKSAGTLPKIVVAVHLTGLPCDMREISDLSDEFGFYVIEDASHAIGASYGNGKIGNCELSDISIFSFHPVKIVTSGEGGAALTNSDPLAEKMQLLRSHGITRDPSLMTENTDGPWYYEQVTLGWNYRMTDIHAALGNSQLKKIEGFLQSRRDLAATYDEKLQSLAAKSPSATADRESAWHLYVITLDDPRNHREVFQKLRKRGIGVNLHYIPVHLQPFYRNFGFQKGDFPVAEDYYSRAISIPIFPSLTSEQQSQTIDALYSEIGVK